MHNIVWIRFGIPNYWLFTHYSLCTGPGSVGQKRQEVKTSGSESKQQKPKNDKEIWTKDEAEYKSKGASFDISNDPREKPKFETFYRQAVSTEDIYLQVSREYPNNI